MKRSLLFLALLVIGFASCKKDDNDAAPTKTPYYVSGVQDVTIQKVPSGNPYTYLNLSLVYDHNEQERVALSLEGVPDGLKYKFTIKSGIPTFNSSLQLVDSGVVAGDYALTLVATGATSGRKTYQFNVTVLAAPDCSGEVAGTGYLSQGYCSGPNTFSQDITSVSGTPGRVLFSNFDNTGAQVYGVVTCFTNQIVIPTQTVGGAVYQGNAYYNTSGSTTNININYSRNGTSCSLNLRK
jgi:hypothetical protein